MDVIMKRTTVDLTRAERCVFSLIELEHDVTLRELLSRFASACMNNKADVERLLFGGQHKQVSMEQLETAIDDLHEQVRQWSSDPNEDAARQEFADAGRAALAAVSTPWYEPEQKIATRAKSQTKPRRAA